MFGIVRLALLLIHLVILGVLSLIFLNEYIPPKVFKWPNFISLAFPVLIIIYIGLTGYWIIAMRKRAILFLIGLLCFFNPIRRWINYSPATQQGDLKMITFNSHGSKDLPDLKDLIKTEDPGIIFFQEKGSGIADRLQLKDYPYSYEEIVVGILSKYPIIEKGDIINDDSNGHAIYADVEIKGKRVRLINLYLEPFYLSKSMVKPSKDQDINEEKALFLKTRLYKSFRLHQDQIAQIKPYIQDSPYPVILGGDFNSVPNSYEYYQLSKGLTDAFMEVGNGLGTSFHDYKFPLRIDYLFSSPEIRPKSYHIDRSHHSSDHYPVIASFSW